MLRGSSLPGYGGAGDGRSHAAAIAVVVEQLATAIRTRKCWPCDCLHDAIDGLATSPWAETLRSILEEGRSLAKAREYDCLGCAVCYPAVAINAIADAAPDFAESIGCCPTSPPVERFGWPPLPGDYRTLRHDAAVAVCTLNAPDLVERLATTAAPGLEQGVQYPEIQREYQKALSYYAIGDLLSNNPEDSVEYKRSVMFQQKFEQEVKTYIDRRKRPSSGMNLRIESFGWNWLQNMPFYQGIK